MRKGNWWIRLALLLLAGAGALTAAPCVPGTLAGYIALGAGGCSIQTNPLPFTEFLVKDFAFTVTGVAGSPTPVTAAAVAVVPQLGPPLFSLEFSSAGFSVGPGQAITYELSYFIDPPPPIIHEFETEMWTETPVFPGSVTIVTSICIGAPFTPGCAGTLATLTVFHNGISHDLFDWTAFAGTNALGVRNVITLDATAGGSADFAGFHNASVPEPRGTLLVAAVLAALALRRRMAEP
jgi:hypothetical protein